MKKFIIHLLGAALFVLILLSMIISICKLNNNRSDYRLHIDVRAYQARTYVYAHAYDQTGKFIENYIYKYRSELPDKNSRNLSEKFIDMILKILHGNKKSTLTGKPFLDAKINVDGQEVSVSKANVINGTTYYADLGEAWKDGSNHSVSISTPDGYSETVSISKPKGGIEGLIFSPPLSTTPAQSYEISYPGGEWPEGSRIDYLITKKRLGSGGLAHFGNDYHPTGDSIVKATDLAKMSEGEVTKQVDFESTMEFKYDLSAYAPGSTITVTGNKISYRSGEASELIKIPGGVMRLF